MYTDTQGLSVEKCVQLASYDAIFTPSTFNKHNLELYGFNTEGDGVRINAVRVTVDIYHT